MAITLAHTQLDVVQTYAGTAPVYYWDATFNPGNPYATGGVALDAAAATAGIVAGGVTGATVTTIQSVIFGESADGQVNYTWGANLVVARNKSGVEIANGTNLAAAGFTAPMRLLGV